MYLLFPHTLMTRDGKRWYYARQAGRCNRVEFFESERLPNQIGTIDSNSNRISNLCRVASCQKHAVDIYNIQLCKAKGTHIHVLNENKTP